MTRDEANDHIWGLTHSVAIELGYSEKMREALARKTTDALATLHFHYEEQGYSSGYLDGYNDGMYDE